jgi:hypothetical protein
MHVEEMRTSSSCYFSAEEVSGLGWAATRAVVLGCQGGLMLGSFAVKVQVRFFSLFSLFLFYNSVLNSNLNFIFEFCYFCRFYPLLILSRF